MVWVTGIGGGDLLASIDHPGITSAQDLPSASASGREPVTLTPDALLIRDLEVRGTALAAAEHCAGEGRDVEGVVREMLEVGGMFLQHGASQAIVGAARSEVERLLSALGERSGALRAVRAAEARQSNPKGLAFQDLIVPAIEAAHAPYGDLVEDTSKAKGIDGSEKGDFTVTLNPDSTGGRDRRVVLEAKDVPRLKAKDALAYLAEAMSNRQAEAGIVVFATPTPALDRPIRVYPGNRILALFDKEDPQPLALEIACQLARTLALNAGQDGQLNAGLLARRLQRLMEIIERSRGIQTSVEQARRALDTIEMSYADMADEAKSVIYELEDALP